MTAPQMTAPDLTPPSAGDATLPVSPDALLARLDAAGIVYEHHAHVPLRTVEEAKAVQHVMRGPAEGGVHIKNLYLRDRRKANHLVVLEQDRVVDLKALGAAIGAPGPSFGSAERLMEHLGVRPGAVTPLSMVTGAAMGVQLHLDPALREAAVVYMHPLVNDRTVGMAPADLLRFLGGLGVAVNWLPEAALRGA